MDALIAILAGGRGTRMGGDKALAELGGRPLISHPLAAAAEAAGDGGEVLVVAKPETALPDLERAGIEGAAVRILGEPPEPVHPLCGVVAALREGDGRAVVVVGGDMPFVTGGLLGWLGGLADQVAVPRVGGRLHPLLARYGPGQLAALEEALRAEAPLRETVAQLDPRICTESELGRFGEPARLLFNVNTPEDLREAERLLAGGA